MAWDLKESNKTNATEQKAKAYDAMKRQMDDAGLANKVAAQKTAEYMAKLDALQKAQSSINFPADAAPGTVNTDNAGVSEAEYKQVQSMLNGGTPTMDDIMYFRKLNSLQDLQGHIGAPADVPPKSALIK